MTTFAMSGIASKPGMAEYRAVEDLKDDSGGGLMLLTALSNFVAPLMTQGEKMVPEIGIESTYTPGFSINKDRPHSADGGVLLGTGLTTEGRDLLFALKQFVASLSRSPKGPETERELPGNQDELQVERTNSVVPEDTNDPSNHLHTTNVLQTQNSAFFSRLRKKLRSNSSLSLDEQIYLTERRIMTQLIDDARDKVFNKMPIHMLTFDEHGNGIKLVDRSEIMEYISSEINSTANLGLSYPQSFEKYAILSHTWLSKGEITYSNWKNNGALLDTQSLGFKKLANFCKVAANFGLRLGWMDTVCINKESSAELDESIRSMFKWYKGSEICIAYLADTRTTYDIKDDKWFTRGWTLQELLAPYHIKFFSKDWKALSNNPVQSDKSDTSPLILQVCEATGLHTEELDDSPNVDSVPIWRKMQWAAKRKVTREEDTAYSLMGIFNVSMPIGYGEGMEHAFLRLVKGILSSKSEGGSVSMLEIANWNLPPWCDSNTSSSSCLIPNSPQAYIKYEATSRLFDMTHMSRMIWFSSNTLEETHFYPPSLPITLSHMGLRVPVLLMPSELLVTNIEAPDNSSPTSAESCNEYTPIDFYDELLAAVHNRQAEIDNILKGREDTFSHCPPKGDYSATFNRGDVIYRVLGCDVFANLNKHNKITLCAVLNISDQATSVRLPENDCCLAINLIPDEHIHGWDIPEDFRFKTSGSPFTFNIVRHNQSSVEIYKDQLYYHGMTLRTLYL